MSKHEEIKKYIETRNQMKDLTNEQMNQRCSCFIAARGDMARELEEKRLEAHAEMKALKAIQKESPQTRELHKCVSFSCADDKFKAECNLGLWGVESHSYGDLMEEAVGYFFQYKEAGEYSSIIGGPSVFDVIMKGKVESSK